MNEMRRSGERTEAIASGTRRGALVILAAAAQLAAALCAASLPAAAAAESPARLVRRGNSSFREGDFARAREHYDLASVRMPESPVVEFNLGAVLYMQDDYAGARERFEEAALRARDLSLEALAWYNSGNCAFRQAERRTDSDPEAALQHLEESVAFYTTALDKDPGLEDAAYNLELARLAIRDLLDRIKQMQERMEEQRELLAAIVDSLAAAMGRQQAALAASRDLAAAPDRGAEPWRERLDSAARGQRGVSETTGAASAALDDLFPGERPAPAGQALEHLDSALVAQHEAREALARGAPEAAAPRQERSAEGIRAAIEALTEGGAGEGGQRQEQSRQDREDETQGDEQAQEEPPHGEEQPQEQPQVAQESRSETARGIIEEERENRRKRSEQESQGYRGVERDW